MRSFVFVFLYFIVCIANSQEWTLKLKSTVALRTWVLTTRADKTEKSAQGATIKLLSGNSVLQEVVSDADGNFELEIPGNSDYFLTVSYPNCSTKKFYVSTKNIPDDVTGSKKGFKPSIKIGGFMMSKPFSGVDYIGLEQPLLKVEYKNKEEGFDKDKDISDKGEEIVSKITDAENVLIDKFCTNTRLGDDALTKKNYQLAKDYYTKALELIPGEEYPTFKLKKAESGIKEEQAKKEAEDLKKAEQIEAARLANEKAIEEKKAAEKAMFDKAAKKQAEKELASKKKNEKTAAKTNTTTPVVKANTIVAVKSTTTSNTSKSNPVIKTNPLTSTNTTSTSPATSSKPRKGKSKYKVANKMGTDRFEDLMDEGDDLIKQKRYHEAKKKFEDALKLKPDDENAKSKLNDVNQLLKTN